MSANGSERRLLKLRATVDAIDWSPSGDEIAWMDTGDLGTGRVRSGTSEIGIMSADGSDKRIIVQAEKFLEGRLFWSHDGHRLAFSCKGDYAVCVVNVDGSGYHRLRELHNGSTAPDGGQMAFSIGRPSHIYVGTPDRRNLRKLTDGPGEDFSPAWSPDGSKIAFTRAIRTTDGTDKAGLFVVNSDGTRLRRIKLPTDYVDTADWSPDGKNIVFNGFWPANCGYCYSDIYTVNINSGRIRELTHKQHASTPAWSPLLAEP